MHASVCHNFNYKLIIFLNGQSDGVVHSVPCDILEL